MAEGALLIGLALLRAGRSMRYVPAPVVEGFTFGIAGVIALQQIPNALGVAAPEGDKVLVVAWRAVQEFAAHPDVTALSITVGVAGLMLLGARRFPTVPFSVVAVVLATVAVQVFDLGAEPIGALPAGLPAPSLGFVEVSALGSLVAPAVAVAALAALESLLSATVADGMTVDQKHDPDRELFGQGVANLAAPLFGGVPATAAIARTAVNVRTGASSRLAALTHAAVLAVIVFAAAPLVSRIPLAALAGVLLATAVRMVEVGALRAMARATRSDAVVLVLTAVATLVLDLVLAVVIGLVVAGALALRAVAGEARMDRVDLREGEGTEAEPPGAHSEEEHALLAEHIVAYRIDGPLFFAGAHRFLLTLSEGRGRAGGDPADVAGDDGGRLGCADAEGRGAPAEPAGHRGVRLGHPPRAAAGAGVGGGAGAAAAGGPGVRDHAGGDRGGTRAVARGGRAGAGTGTGGRGFG